jgi:hypothetical protein
VLLDDVLTVLVLAAERNVAVIALPCDLLVNSLLVPLHVSHAVEARTALFTCHRLVGRVFALVMLPENLLMELFATFGEAAGVERWEMVAHVKSQILDAGVELAAGFARHVLVAVDVLDVLLQVALVES